MNPNTPRPQQAVFRHQLLTALSRPELQAMSAATLNNPAQGAAAHGLAVALGRCRIFGADPGKDLDGSLPAHLAVAAARELLILLEAWTEEAVALETAWSECKDSFETENLCMGVLEDRMDAWAAFVAIDEAYSASLDGGGQPEEFPELIGRVTDALETFDDALEEQEDLLSCVTETHLLENWRNELAGPHREQPPWWLDGRLEEAARRCQEEAVASMPDASLWRKLRRAVPKGHALDAAAALVWESPDGANRAELMLPELSSPEEETRQRPLTFLTTDLEPAALAGQTATLAGVARPIDADSRAWYTLAELRQASELTLTVGGPAEHWLPMEETD